MRSAALTCLISLLLAILLLVSASAEAVQRGANRPAPEPLRPPSPASCQLQVDSELAVLVSTGRGSELGEQVRCASAGDAVLMAELPPGQTAQAWLLVENSGSETISVAAVHTRASGSRIGLDGERIDIAPGSSLRLDITLDIEPDTAFGTAFLHQINLILHGSDGNEHSLSLPVRLEAIDPDELFRQRFEVEPVLGQFL
ncbi:MAG: hypothetical protein EA370_18050 [Wenzhouxiangella sp.]|nr:MAG: hypothetical protein EA370_18050 [Wenzhouxiangella sp.]